MPSSLTSYFAGITTAGVAVVLGFGGALVVSTATPGTQPSLSRVERQTKSVSHDSIAKHEVEFPSRAEPVIATPMPSLSTVASELRQSTLQNSEQRAELSAPAVTNSIGVSENDDALQENAVEPKVQSSNAAVISKETDPSPKLNQMRQSVASVIVKQQRKVGLKSPRDSAQESQRRIAERKKQHEIAAATLAVRRMLRDRQEAREDMTQRPFNMGFSVD